METDGPYWKAVGVAIILASGALMAWGIYLLVTEVL